MRSATSPGTSEASIERARSVITEGRAGWFLPDCVLPTAAESEFTQSVTLVGRRQ